MGEIWDKLSLPMTLECGIIAFRDITSTLSQQGIMKTISIVYCGSFVIGIAVELSSVRFNGLTPHSTHSISHFGDAVFEGLKRRIVISSQDLTRKLCYRKDDYAMRAI